MAEVSTLTLEMVDTVSPILKSISAIAGSGLLQDASVVMPTDAVVVAALPGSTKAVLLPSMTLLSVLSLLAQNAAMECADKVTAANEAAYEAWKASQAQQAGPVV